MERRRRAVNVLIDTHILLWLVSTPAQLDPLSLSDPATTVWVSAASAWEIAIKTRIGRLGGEALLAAWPDVLSNMHSLELPIDSADAILAGRLRWAQKDPFDPVIVAQALRRNLTIATRDDTILTTALTPVLRS